jgi:regulator of replication initiation timing
MNHMKTALLLILALTLASPLALAEPEKRLTPMEELRAEVEALREEVVALRAEVAKLKEKVAGKAPEPEEAPAGDGIEIGMTKAEAKAALDRMGLKYKAGAVNKTKAGKYENWEIDGDEAGEPTSVYFRDGVVDSVLEF